MRVKLTLLTLLSLVFLVFTTSTSAQARSVFWESWDVIINNIDTADNSFDVREQYQVRFNGTFEFGSAVIPLDRVEAIENVRVYQDGRPLQAGRCVDSASQGRGTFCVELVAEGISIVYYFFRPISNATESFEIVYTVVGGLRVYEGGDQLWWIAVPAEKFGFSVGSSTIRVEMPQGYAPREGIDPVETYGVTADISVTRNTIVATAREPIDPDETFEIRLQYPHNSDARIANWQENFDRRRDFEEKYKPWLNIGLIVISLLLGIGGPLFVFTHWRNRGRDPKVGPVPTFLTEPPSGLRPAVVGTLLDETADTRDVLSTLIDLAEREYLVIEEDRSEGFFGIGGSTTHTFKRTDKPATDLHSYEQQILNRVFQGKLERTLDSLKNKFYQYMSSLQDDLYSELVDGGLFKAKPSTTRGVYSAIAVGVLGVAGFLGFIFFGMIEELSPALLCLPSALAFTGVALFVAGQHMPAKTQQGALEAAKWRAFQEYLQNLEKYTDVENVTEQFTAFLPYAVAFGMDRSWIRRFSKLETSPVPTWYYPTYRGGRYRGGYRSGSPIPRTPSMRSGEDMLPGDLARAGGGLSLDTMSTDISTGLNSISDGLTNMLNSASSTLTSRPSSSGGSGGWSGGGSSGGGGGGGGSRGFG
jgi:uncharacterized membrane protein YgcG